MGASKPSTIGGQSNSARGVERVLRVCYAAPQSILQQVRPVAQCPQASLPGCRPRGFRGPLMSAVESRRPAFKRLPLWQKRLSHLPHPCAVRPKFRLEPLLGNWLARTPLRLLHSQDKTCKVELDTAPCQSPALSHRSIRLAPMLNLRSPCLLNKPLGSPVFPNHNLLGPKYQHVFLIKSLIR